jgi:hypothetical protein
MKKNSMRFPGLYMLLGFSLLLLFAGPSAGGWSANTDANGNVVSMTCSNPEPGNSIESKLIFVINAEGKPASGIVRFKDDVERDMTEGGFTKLDGEVPLYWDMYHGEAALWDYLRSRDRVDFVDPSKDKISSAFLFKNARLIYADGFVLFGKVTRFGVNPDGFVFVTNNGKEVYVDNMSVKELQVKK